ncbi:related to 26s proteasome subunit p28 [Cephalotrichum gorgonifer]|uniref:Related to 26s proteasome subunit p28 n=1 Tax=Cephalotrichum gorgonifer TaxID=2041049 RepID=A0AAE8SRJ8_9PEZI|nr:related to 26s proteasome subunit p28 [Cephalotrichum gorgonifer]
MATTTSDAPKFPLHEACRRGNLSLVEQLVKESPKKAYEKDGDGRLPIHWAASSNSAGIVLLLSGLPGFDPDVQDESGWSPFMIASNVNDSEEVLNVLLGRDADINQKNYNGQTPLHLIASKNKLDMARTLFDQKPPASARVRDKRGQYPIHRAAAIGSTPMITLLLEHRSPLDATDNSGYTALHHAIAEGHGDAAVTLLKAGADSTKREESGLLAIDLAPDVEVRPRTYRMVGMIANKLDTGPTVH